MEKRIFYITTQGLTIYWSAGKRLHEDRRFEADSAGIDAFTRYAQPHTDIISHVIIDIIEEEYRHDSIPHVHGRDRQAILQRKLAQLFHQTPYRCAELQGRSKFGRRDDQVLFAALTNPERIKPWLTAMDESKIPVAGVYSLSSLTQALFKKLKLRSEHALLITTQQDSTIRQTYLNQRTVKISRTTPLGRHTTSERGDLYQQEAQKNKRYLNRLQLLPQQATLDVYVVCDSSEIAILQTQCPDSDALRFHFISMHEVATKIGVSAALNEQRCELIFIHLLTTQVPALDYASNNDRRYYLMHQARKITLAASLLLLLGCIVWSAAGLLHVEELKQQSKTIAQQTHYLKEGQLHLTSLLPKTEISPTNMETVVTIANTLDHYKSEPQRILVAISQGLKAFEQVQIDEILWSSATSLSNAQQVDGQIEPAAAQDAASEQSQNYQVAIIRGKLIPFDGNYEDAFQMVSRFVATLRDSERFVSVDATQLPLDIKSSSTLSLASGRDAQKSLAPFEIRAVMQVRDAS